MPNTRPQRPHRLRLARRPLPRPSGARTGGVGCSSTAGSDTCSIDCSRSPSPSPSLCSKTDASSGAGGSGSGGGSRRRGGVGGGGGGGGGAARGAGRALRGGADAKSSADVRNTSSSDFGACVWDGGGGG